MGNNPGHNNTFNSEAERVARDEQPRLEGLMNISGEYADPDAELHRHIASEAVDTATDDTADKVEKLIPEPFNPKPVYIPRDGRSHRDDVDTNEDGSPNVLAPK